MRSRPIRTLAIASLLAGLSATAGNVVLGQQTATLVITVIDSAARYPLANADVIDLNTGQRRFTDVHLEQLSIARCLRESGMPIADVARYAELVRAGDHTIDERIALLEEHEARVRAKMKSLRDQQRYIERKIAYYRTVR